MKNQQTNEVITGFQNEMRKIQKGINKNQKQQERTI